MYWQMALGLEPLGQYWPAEVDGERMIIQTAPAGTPRLAISMSEHNVLCQQFAQAFGNQRFQVLEPLDLMTYVIANHDAGWLEFDRDPRIDDKTSLPYNLIDTPPEYVTVTSRLSPEFNQRHHPFTGLISSMHSWGLYNGRYGLSKLVLIDKIPAKDRSLTDIMLGNELERQKRLKGELAKDPKTSGWLEERKVLQNYKQLQFIDTLALYFNRIHPSERGEQTFENVPLNAQEDVNVVIHPAGENVYALSPFPFAASGAEFGCGGRRIEPSSGKVEGGWPAALRQAPSEWEIVRLVAA